MTIYLIKNMISELGIAIATSIFGTALSACTLLRYTVSRTGDSFAPPGQPPPSSPIKVITAAPHTEEPTRPSLTLPDVAHSTAPKRPC